MFKTLFSKLFTTYVALIVLTLFIMAIFLFRVFEDVYFSSKIEELSRQGDQVAEVVASHLGEDENIPAVYQELDLIDDFLEARVWILNKDGEIIACTPRMTFDQDRAISRGDKERVFDNERVVERGYNPSFEENMLTIGVPISNENAEDNEVKGAVFLHSPVVGFMATIGQKRQFIFYAASIAIVCSIIAAYFLSKSISNPLFKMNKAALAMADGSFDHRVPVKTKDEVGQLSESFNYLGKTLQKTIDELNQEKNKLESILQGMGEGVLAVDKNYNILMANNQVYELFDFSLFQGKLSEYGLYKYFKHAIEWGEVLEEEISVNDDKLIYIMVTPLYDFQSEIWGSVALIRDVTEVRKLENIRRDFVANVSHELRTPLTSIRGFLEALVDGVVEDKETKERYYNIMLEETIRLDRLINDLLDLSKIESGKVEWEFKKIDLNFLFEDIKNKLKPQLEGNEINLLCKIPPDISPVRGDYDRISQIFINLLDNAVKFTPRGKNIEVGAKELYKENKVKIWVKDEGEGIDEKELKKIWQRFHKVEKSRNRSISGSGTGLGLSIVKHLVENHGGEVEVESITGKGTTFTFTLEIYSVGE